MSTSSVGSSKIVSNQILDGLFFRKYFTKLERLSEFCFESYSNKIHKTDCNYLFKCVQFISDRVLKESKLKTSNNIFNYNFPGSYECDCDLGFSFSNGTCLDVDECILGDNPCIHGTCENLSPG